MSSPNQTCPSRGTGIKAWIAMNITYEGTENSHKDDGDSSPVEQQGLPELGSQLLYKVNDIPPWYLCIFLAFQHYLMMFICTAATPLIFASAMCLPLDGSDICDVINSLFFVSGLTTILQNSVGVRLPIVQGASFSFLLPLFAILMQNEECPDLEQSINGTNISTDVLFNSSVSYELSKDDENAPWKERMRGVQGSLMVASCLQIIMGATGMIQFTLKFIGPITIAPVIALIGLSLFEVAADTCALNWPMSILLPIVQGASFSFLLPLFAILMQNEECPDLEQSINGTNISTDVLFNSSVSYELSKDDENAPWKERMRGVQGSLMVASCLQIIMGATGMIQFTLKFIGPITIAPVIALIGLSLFEVAADTCALNWPMSILTMILITVCAQYMAKVTIPLCNIKPESQDENIPVSATPTRLRLPIFTMFCWILPMMIVWFVCYILTLTGALGEDEDSWGYQARTDLKLDALLKTAWFRVPFPFQWGMPSASLGGILGMIAGTWASIVESIGNYYACAMIAGEPPPPNHAINRGIVIDGLGCLMSGMWGTGVGSTAYGINVGILGITRVGSRRVVQVTGLIMITLALFGKLGALFVTIPEPILGGTYMIMFGILVGVAISSLKHVDITSSRNLYILGTSILLGLSIPHWLAKNPRIINTGVVVLDQIINVLLATGMFLSGIIAFIMDNTISGTLEERGLHVWKKMQEQDPAAATTIHSNETYNIPFISKYEKLFLWTRYLPFCPGFQGFRCIDKK